MESFIFMELLTKPRFFKEYSQSLCACVCTDNTGEHFTDPVMSCCHLFIFSSDLKHEILI